MKRYLGLLLCLLVLVLPACALAQQAWFEPYLAILEKNDHELSDANNQFGLIDVNMDGTPELLVAVYDAKKKNTYGHIYRYAGGKTQRCASVKMGSADWGLEIGLYRDGGSRAVWMVTAVDARKVEVDAREYLLTPASGGNIIAKEKFRYRITFAGKSTDYVNGKKVSSATFVKKRTAWYDPLTGLDDYPGLYQPTNLRQVLGEAAAEFAVAKATILDKLR